MKRRARDDFHPLALSIAEFARTWIALVTRCLHQTRLREIAGEEAGVHGDRGDHAGSSEADQRPVVSALAPAARLPTVDDLASISVMTGVVDGRIGFEEVLLVTER